MKEGSKVKNQKIVLNIVVQGTAVIQETTIHQPLKSLVGKTLADAGVVGGVDNWYFSDELGSELDADKSIEELGLASNQTILLNQRAGAAG